MPPPPARKAGSSQHAKIRKRAIRHGMRLKAFPHAGLPTSRLVNLEKISRSEHPRTLSHIRAMSSVWKSAGQSFAVSFTNIPTTPAGAARHPKMFGTGGFFQIRPLPIGKRPGTAGPSPLRSRACARGAHWKYAPTTFRAQEPLRQLRQRQPCRSLRLRNPRSRPRELLSRPTPPRKSPPALGAPTGLDMGAPAVGEGCTAGAIDRTSQSKRERRGRLSSE